jgi:alpha-D-ribose 1-methylphosphonate 5-triphosphate synthase subunit PhnI
MKKYVELFALFFILAEINVMYIHCELVEKYVCQMSEPIQFTKPYGITVSLADGSRTTLGNPVCLIVMTLACSMMSMSVHIHMG